MNAPGEQLPPKIHPLALSPERTLRRLFLTLFLRGRSARGLRKERAPTSVGEKLGLVLFLYALMGCMSFIFVHQSVFALAVYLHAMTFVFLGMFVAASTGEILFNKEEADILLHRPITPQAILWAKIRVLVEVSLWLAGAFNLAGLVAGIFTSDGGWKFPLAHAVSTSLEAFFCTGSVVLSYQLCLRWFGRERLEGLMTTAQVIVSVFLVMSGQIMPRIVLPFIENGHLYNAPIWVGLLPPAWFAGLDDALAGSGGSGSWMLGGLAVAVTVLVLWLAFDKLAKDYEVGLQSLNETVSDRKQKTGRRRWIEVLIGLPPFNWWLREPVSRASFLLTAAYLTRDRDTKLRLYPSIAPMLTMPFMMLLQNHHHGGEAAVDSIFAGLGLALTGAMIGLVPLQGIMLIQYSQQWQAADIFHLAPLHGPAELCHGARRAVLCFLTFPLMVVLAVILWFLLPDHSQLLLLLPAIIILPVIALIPILSAAAAPLSRPTEDAKNASTGCFITAGAMTVSGVMSILSMVSWHFGWFWYYVAAELVVALVVYAVLRSYIASNRWLSLE